jgi:hypothetical protein
MPGDATAHQMLTIHESPANMTSVPRWSCINLYFPEDALYVGNPSSEPALSSGAVRPGHQFDHPDYPVIWRPESS